LHACRKDTADGAKLAEYRLAAAPRWDGLSITAGRIFVSLLDGRILCLGDRHPH
jgi:hypothetical protein